MQRTIGTFTKQTNAPNVTKNENTEGKGKCPLH